MTTLRPRLSAHDVDVICDHVADYGAKGVESGGMLVTSADGMVRFVAISGTSNVRRGWGLFQLQAPAIAQLFDFVEDRDLQVAAMFHSHKYEAFLSDVDREEGINMTGFTSIVLPTFAGPPRNVDAWGWWDFDGTHWRDRPAGHLHDGPPAAVIVFDGEGVREL